MYSTPMGACCMVFTLLAFFCQCSKGFVVLNPGQSRSRLTTGASRRDMRAAQDHGPQPASSVPTSDIDGGCGWRTSAELRSRQRRRRGSGAGQHNGVVVVGGVGSLRAGMDMPALDAVGYLGSALLEQSQRHHYPSAFIGGTVGVLGTLTAIQVWVCMCAYVYSSMRMFQCVMS